MQLGKNDSGVSMTVARECCMVNDCGRYTLNENRFRVN